MPKTLIALSITAATFVGMWAYVLRVANPNIRLQAIITGDRAGDLGDLYPRWYGTRQLILFGRSPYGRAVSEELQLAYYGHIVGDGLQDEQRFAYPIYACLFLLPTVNLTFPQVQIIATWVMAGAIALSVLLWLRFIGWQLTLWKVVMLALLVLSSAPAVQALEMQQLGTLVCTFIAAGALMLRRRAYVLSGMFLAFATIKPQMVLLLCLWLLLWTASKWRERKNLLLSFSAGVTLLIVLGEWMSPGWIREFIAAMAAYRHYAGGSAQSLVEMFAGRAWGIVITLAALIGLAGACFKWRIESPESTEFAQIVTLALASTTVIIPPAAPYNHLLLLPGVLILLRSWTSLWNSGSVMAGISLLATIAIVWPWITAISLLLVSFFSPVQRWSLPFYCTLIVPLSVTALLALPHITPPAIERAK